MMLHLSQRKPWNMRQKRPPLPPQMGGAPHPIPLDQCINVMFREVWGEPRNTNHARHQTSTKQVPTQGQHQELKRYLCSRKSSKSALEPTRSTTKTRSHRTDGQQPRGEYVTKTQATMSFSSFSLQQTDPLASSCSNRRSPSYSHSAFGQTHRAKGPPGGKPPPGLPSGQLPSGH